MVYDGGGVGRASGQRARRRARAPSAQALKHVHQAKEECPSRTTDVTTTFLLLHVCGPGGGTFAGDGRPVIIAMSKHSGPQGVEKCVRNFENALRYGFDE